MYWSVYLPAECICFWWSCSLCTHMVWFGGLNMYALQESIIMGSSSLCYFEIKKTLNIQQFLCIVVKLLLAPLFQRHCCHMLMALIVQVSPSLCLSDLFLCCPSVSPQSSQSDSLRSQNHSFVYPFHN